MKNLSRFVLLSLLFLTGTQRLWAQELKVLISGSTHAMLYPCHCPLQPDGGVARRATLVKELRAKYPHLLLLDAGSSFAGGLLDEYSQNPQLDQQRTLVQLAAMDQMGYDAAALSDDEFNFSSAFLAGQIAKRTMRFVSANIALGGVEPYIIKRIEGVSVAVIGLTPATVGKKEQGLAVADPAESLSRAISAARQAGADIVVVLSTLGDEKDVRLAKMVPGIDVLVTAAQFRSQEAPKIEGPVVVRPVWQGRRMVLVTLTVRDKKVTASSSEELRLSDRLADDKQVRSILPVCFSDTQCKKEAFQGQCLQPGSAKASCSFRPADKVALTVISRLDCRTCDTGPVIEYLKKQVPGLSVTRLYYPDAKAASLVTKLSGKTLPVYLFGPEIEKDSSFATLQKALQRTGDFYVVKPESAGVGFFLGREKIPQRLDVFMSLYDKNATALLDVLKEFNPRIHFLVQDSGKGLTAPNDVPELEEDLRAVCVQKLYPGFFWSYIRCRAEAIRSSWWEDCLSGSDASPVRACARSAEGQALLRSNLALGRELEIVAGPTYLMDNQEIFGSVNVPTKEELRKIIRR